MFIENRTHPAGVQAQLEQDSEASGHHPATAREEAAFEYLRDEPETSLWMLASMFELTYQEAQSVADNFHAWREGY